MVRVEMLRDRRKVLRNDCSERLKRGPANCFSMMLVMTCVIEMGGDAPRTMVVEGLSAICSAAARPGNW